MLISYVPKAGSAIFNISLVFLFVLLGRGNSLAQQPASTSSQSFPDVAAVAGPETANLGDLAEIAIPAGYRFIEPTGARQILTAMKNPVPRNLLGLLRPESGGWFAIVQFADLGYVSDANAALNSTGILKAVRANFARQNKALAGPNVPAIGKVDWAVAPTYSAIGNRLEYAVQEGEPGSGTINYCVAILGRKGVITVVGVLPNQPGMDLAPFREMANGITFKQGERYADHQADDRISHATLAELVANDNGLASYARAAVAQIESKGPWAAVAAALLFAGWRLTAAAMKSRRPVRTANGSPRRTVVRQASENGSRHVPRPATATLSARVANGKSRRQLDRRRKKRFSYHAFYSDMVMSLTRCNYVGGFGTFSTEYPEDINGTTAPEGTAHPILIRHPQAPAATDSREATSLALESAKLIESQQKLIEGQRKLIEEQSKVIQEKGRIIDAENRVMEKQAELFAEEQLL